VIAALLTSEIGTGDVPFDEESIIGANNLRGYTSGKYRDAQTYTAQAEYRWRFWRRWGVAAFAGFGYAVEKPSEIAWDDTLPSAGFGFRYLMVQEYKINVRVDFAWGKDDRGIYFMIGEAF
jgi:outer membrane translocation and assembly module TamA